MLFWIWLTLYYTFNSVKTWKPIWNPKCCFFLRIQVWPKKGITPIIFVVGMGLNHQSYSIRNGFGFLGCRWTCSGSSRFQPLVFPGWNNFCCHTHKQLANIEVCLSASTLQPWCLKGIGKKRHPKHHSAAWKIQVMVVWCFTSAEFRQTRFNTSLSLRDFWMWMGKTPG